jgi:hypothetical protein
MKSAAHRSLQFVCRVFGAYDRTFHSKLSEATLR